MRLIADSLNLTVAHVPEGALEVSDLSHAKAYGLNDAVDFADINRVSDTELVLKNQEQTADQIAHQTLGTKTDGRSDDSGTSD